MIERIETITNSIIDETLGNVRIFGKDQYSDLYLEYPECYAMFILSLNSKYKITRNARYKDQARMYINLLLELAYKSDDEVWWGLPFDWGDTKKNEGFLITTAFCLKALYVWYKDGVYTDHDTIKKVLSYCFSLYRETEDEETGFWYSKKLNRNIYNATSIAVGVLAQAKDLLSSEEEARLKKIIDMLISSQRNGYWNYSSELVDVDLLHQCYTCEGIFDYAEKFSNNKAVKVALMGVDFVQNNMTIYRFERYLFRLTDPERIATRLKYLFLKILTIFNAENIRFSKTRAWSYAAYIRVLIYSYRFTKETKYLELLNDTISYLCSRLIVNRSILFSVSSKESYVRHTYHVLFSLCQYELLIRNGE